MQLKKIKLVGFKSFVDPQVLEFRNGVSCIVGPNGCGKSNIIDAVKWVIGESSAKQLRTENMSDVIFNGSTGRSPVGQAQVELLFDNADTYFKGTWAQYEEVALRRSVYRDGQSSYYLNNTRCRRKDITDLFLGTGLGARSYAIIEQGMVSRFIDAKPLEVRNHIEEAAGISKYKERRRETLSKLEETADNLSRLDDLKKELENRVKRLSQEAIEAQRYQELKILLVNHRQQNFALLWKKVQEDYKTTQIAFDSSKLDKAQKEDALFSFQKLNTVQFKKFQQKEFELKQIQQTHQDQILVKKDRFYQLEQARAKVAYTQETLKELQSRLEELKTQEVLAAQALAESQNAAPDQGGLDQFKILSQALQKEVIELQQDFLKKQQNYKKLMHIKQEPRARVEAIKTNLHHLEQGILDREAFSSSAQLEIESLHQQKKGFEDSQAQQLLQQCQEELKQTELRLQEEEASLEKLQQARVLLDQQFAKVDQETRFLDEKMAKVTKDINTLNAQPSAWLKHAQLDEQEVFFQNRPKNGYQHLYAALSTSFLYSVNGQPNIDLLKQNADRDLEICWGEPSNFVGFEQPAIVPSYWQQWKHASSFEEALNHLQTMDENEVLLLPNGGLLGKNWLRPARSRYQPSLAELLAQQSSINERQEEVRAKKEQLSEEMQIFKAKLAALQAQRLEIVQKVKVDQKQVQDASIKVERLTQQKIALSQRTEKLEQQLHDARQQILKNQRQTVDFRSELESLMELIGQQETSVDLLDQELKETQKSLEEKQAQLRINQQAVLDEQKFYQEWQLSYQRRQSQHQDIIKHQQMIAQEYQQKTKLLEESLQPLTAHQELFEQSQNDEARTSLEVTRIDQEYHELTQANLKLSQEMRRLEKETALSQEKLHKLEIQLERDLLEQKHIYEQILDFGWDPEQIGQVEINQSLVFLKKSIQNLQTQIEEMGQINLKAIEEYKKESARLEELIMQHQDVTSACEQLQEAVNALDGEIQQAFDDTFGRLKSSFSRLFPLLFGGGQATLMQEEDDDLSEEEKGIVIKAQPPGKKNTLLSVLSGGEKALTAAALVFSFFQLNPAPFCLLDEVDAPLDDSNTLRLARMIKELSGEIQFIVVTHSKIMMEQADHLFGVTMREPGVSRLVSVDMKEALELAQV